MILKNTFQNHNGNVLAFCKLQLQPTDIVHVHVKVEPLDRAPRWKGRPSGSIGKKWLNSKFTSGYRYKTI